MNATPKLITVMQRVEMKYLLSPAQVALLRQGLQGRMQPDAYGLTTIGSLYYDTPDHRLINRSLEQPGYKEKIRLRSYGVADNASPVFLELKRKAEGVVYKRRAAATLDGVRAFFAGQDRLSDDAQIDRELAYFRDFYGDLAPACLIMYDRTAYEEPGGDLRLTIDANPRYRTDRLDLRLPMEGTPLLPKGWAVLEIKVQQAMPLWLTALLAKGKIYKTSFSKYGTAYRMENAPALRRSA